jgi:hypothetical protein
VKGTRSEARTQRDEMRRANNRGEFIVPSKLTVGARESPLQKLDATDVEQYHADHLQTHKGSTLSLHHAVLSGALKSAVRKKIDTGMRKGELCDRLWKDGDLGESTVTVHQRLLKLPVVKGQARRTQPVFGPTKSKAVPTRVIHIDQGTVRLREHKRIRRK